MLRDEVELRTGVRWALAGARPAAGPVISIGQTATAPPPAESFRNQVAEGSVNVAGRDPRGVLFGVGHLLRNLDMRRGRVTIDASYSIATSPETALRGHQLGWNGRLADQKYRAVTGGSGSYYRGRKYSVSPAPAAAIRNPTHNIGFGVSFGGWSVIVTATLITGAPANTSGIT